MMAMRPVWGVLLALSAAWAGVSAETCASGAAVTAGYVTGAQYGAGGGLTEWRLGNAGKGAVAYNSRQQAVRMRWSAGNGGGLGCGASGDEWCIELGYGGGVETSNNGNVTGQKIWAKKGGGGYLQLQ
jgi:hypothetical protein